MSHHLRAMQQVHADFRLLSDSSAQFRMSAPRNTELNPIILSLAQVLAGAHHLGAVQQVYTRLRLLGRPHAQHILAVLERPAGNSSGGH